jgi:hypothetical protein
MPAYYKIRGRVLFFFLIMLPASWVGCGSDGELPINSIKKQFSDVPTYSIVLDDMKEEGNFIASFSHKYKVVQSDDVWTTDWMKVPENYYRANEPFLGMTLFSKKEGEEITDIAPPGYHYVGDSRYGRWRTDSHGNSFWEFYGKYRLMSDLFGGWYRPVYATDFNTYERFKRKNTPYYGSKNQYGTSGNIAKKSRPDFYARRMTKEKQKRSSFSDKVNSRVGRTRANSRGRSGSSGK